MKLNFFFGLVAILALNSCNAFDKHIKPNDAAIAYMGRMAPPNYDFADISWPGSSITIEFESPTLRATLNDATGKNCFYFIVDSQFTRVQLDSGLKTYTLAEGLAAGKHKATIYKLTEGKMGHTRFYGFDVNKEGKTIPVTAPVNQRKMEFYGNSITVGYSVDDTVEDRKNPEFFNNYYSYASITARHYQAKYNIVAKSGIGLMLSWFRIIMPEMYDRVHEDDSLQKWNFNSFIPDVVVIDLLQNDSWLVKKHKHPEFIHRFDNQEPDSQKIISAYQDFLFSIRKKYPQATLICTLGSMDATKEGSPWPNYVATAVQKMEDPKMLSFFFPYKNTPGHPKRKEQQAMANQLIQFIDQHVKW